ncbi:MAG: hypothetical protein GXY42_11645 [Desulfovibrionales bacterium]|nr:hypothetical protein [Desulfovibrionales bacterium]
MSDYLVWPWRPLRPITETLEWLTDIIEAHAGAEQRIRVRQEPRQSFEASTLLNDPAELAKLRVALSAWQHREWGWPCWHETLPLAATLPAASSTIYVDTTAADFRDGGLAIIYQGPSLYEVVEIDAVAADSVTLAGPTTMGHPAGASVMPLRMARMAAQARRDDHAVEASRYSVTMQITDNVELTTAAAAMQYLGYDVLSDPLLMPGETMPREIERPLDILDPGPGAWATFARTDYPLITTDHKWRVKTKAQAWAFRRWLHRRAGRLNPVWIPSRTHDLVLAVQPTSVATTLQINDVNYRNVGLNAPGMTHIAAFSASGAFVCRKITEATAGSAGRENLTINAALGFTDVSRLSFLCLHRLTADRVTMIWDRVGVATCTAPMTGVAA